jgi:serine/threonine-protein kinase HipA
MTETRNKQSGKTTQTARPTVLEVWLGEVRVGSLTNLAYDENLFMFDNAYITDANRPVLSLAFLDPHGKVIEKPQQVRTRVPPFFSNLLPEGHLRDYLADRGSVKAAREFFLLWLLGTDLPGAVGVQDAEGRSLPPPDAENTRPQKTGGREVLRFSLAGVQLKFSAIGQPGRQLAIPVEGRGGHWIVKLPSSRYPLVPENEYSMMKLAERVGIEVAEVSLVPTNEIENLPPELDSESANSLVVRRFDRTTEGGRIHIEDFNQLYNQFPERKYKNYSYGNMAGDIWRVMGEEALKEFVRRLIFNAAIGNADMHLKNWSVIYPDGKTPRLAPGYDFVSTVRYIADPTMALSMAKEKDTKYLDEELLTRFARRTGVPTNIVIASAHDIVDRLNDAWKVFSVDLPLDNEMRAQINKRLAYVPLTRKLVTNNVAAPQPPPVVPHASAPTASTPPPTPPAPVPSPRVDSVAALEPKGRHKRRN